MKKCTAGLQPATSAGGGDSVFREPPLPSRLVTHSEPHLHNGAPIKRSKSERNHSNAQLSKTLSRSHDNLASQLRKKATAAALEGKGDVKFKVPKSPVPEGPLVRKAHSTQTINKSEEPMMRTQSAQNICAGNKQAHQEPVKKLQNAPKRAVSTQNISNKQKSRQARIAASNSNAMAYNAELLASFEKEKKSFERLISELRKESENRKTEIECLKIELKHSKEKILSESQSDNMHQENKQLRAKLSELGVSVDSEKTDKHPSNSSDLKEAVDPAASTLGTCDSEIAFSILSDLSCHTPEHPSMFCESNWDRQSNKSDTLSEISVACLQDRISQMEETHYSTNEELQATLHELKDLQDTVNELALENERLNDEKGLLLESLCAQTEKLENYRMQVDHLKQLVVTESESGDRSRNERELVSLIKMGQEEKEELLLRQMELSNSLHSYENETRELQDVIRALQDKTHVLEHKNESLSSDKRTLEKQLAELKEQNAKEHIDMSRYKTLLENEKQKVLELEQYRKATDKSDIEELLDNTRQEKERLEERLANKQEEVEMTRNEVMKLNEQLQSQSEQMKVLKNNTKTEVHDFEYRMALKEKEKQESQEEISTLRDHIDQLQLDCDRYLEERRRHSTVVNKLELDVKQARQKITEAENELKEMKHKYSEDQGEWRQLHEDLLKTVVIANDIKTEAQDTTEQIQAENQFLRDRTDCLQDELNLVQSELEKLHREKEQVSGIRGRVINTVDRELHNLRIGRETSFREGVGKQPFSVKQLIHTIEEQVKNPTISPTAGSPLSPTIPIIEDTTPRRNSTDGVNGMKEELEEGVVENRRQSEGGQIKSLLRKKDGNKDARTSLGHRHTISNIIYESAPAPTDSRTSPSSTKSPDKKAYTSILKESSGARVRHSSFGEKEKSPEKQPLVFTSQAAQGIKSDPLANLAKLMGGSKRNALLKWCQQKSANYPGIDITNFSSSWNDGLAFCALLHSYLPDLIPFKELNTQDKLRNFTLAFKAGESVNIPSFLNASDMASMERPDWQAVMAYITNIYRHFEVDNKPS